MQSARLRLETLFTNKVTSTITTHLKLIESTFSYRYSTLINVNLASLDRQRAIIMPLLESNPPKLVEKIIKKYKKRIAELKRINKHNQDVLAIIIATTY